MNGLSDHWYCDGTLYVKKGPRGRRFYLRQATTVPKEDFTSAVGTWMDARNPVVAKLDNGEAQYGNVVIFDHTYEAGYEPIHDVSGKVIGAYFVGYKIAGPLSPAGG